MGVVSDQLLVLGREPSGRTYRLVARGLWLSALRCARFDVWTFRLLPIPFLPLTVSSAISVALRKQTQ